MSQISASLEQLRRAFLAEAEAAEEAEAGSGGATNVSDVEAAFDNYIYGIVDEIQQEYDLDDDEALDYVFEVAQSLEGDMGLPEIPEGDDLKALAQWLGAAATLQFGQLVLATLGAEFAEE